MTKIHNQRGDQRRTQQHAVSPLLDLPSCHTFSSLPGSTFHRPSPAPQNASPSQQLTRLVAICGLILLTTVSAASGLSSDILVKEVLPCSHQPALSDSVFSLRQGSDWAFLSNSNRIVHLHRHHHCPPGSLDSKGWVGIFSGCMPLSESCFKGSILTAHV